MDEQKRFGPGDVVVGDWAWGVDAWRPHPVVRVNQLSITVGIRRVVGGWQTTQTLQWADIRRVIPAKSDPDPDVDEALTVAASRVRGGHLGADQREALAALLLIAGSSTLPTPLVASVVQVIDTLTGNPRGDGES